MSKTDKELAVELTIYAITVNTRLAYICNAAGVQQVTQTLSVEQIDNMLRKFYSTIASFKGGDIDY